MKSLKMLLAAMMVFTLAACSSEKPAEEAAPAEEKTEETEAVEPASYTVYNQTGEVAVVTLTDLTNEELLAEIELADGENAVIEVTLNDGEAKEDKVYDLTYVTESGREGTFNTLHYEVAPITLLAEDAITGATQIAFSVPKVTATYTIYNVTGEPATVTLTDKGDNAVIAELELADGENDVIEFELNAGEEKGKEYNLTYVTESGREGSFDTLHFEVAPISLLAEDAITGATQIAFKAAE